MQHMTQDQADELGRIVQEVIDTRDTGDPRPNRFYGFVAVQEDGHPEGLLLRVHPDIAYDVFDALLGRGYALADRGRSPARQVVFFVTPPRIGAAMAYSYFVSYLAHVSPHQMTTGDIRIDMTEPVSRWGQIEQMRRTIGDAGKLSPEQIRITAYTLINRPETFENVADAFARSGEILAPDSFGGLRGIVDLELDRIAQNAGEVLATIDAEDNADELPAGAYTSLVDALTVTAALRATMGLTPSATARELRQDRNRIACQELGYHQPSQHISGCPDGFDPAE